MSQFDWPITKIRLKLWKLPKIQDSKMEYLPLGPTYIGEKGRILA
jgi:hypothetical protein